MYFAHFTARPCGVPEETLVSDENCRVLFRGGKEKKKISEITRRKRAKKCRQINVNIYFMTPLRTLSCDMRGELKVREEEEGEKKPL